MGDSAPRVGAVFTQPMEVDMMIRLTFVTGSGRHGPALRFAPDGATAWTPEILDDGEGRTAHDWRAGGRWTTRVEDALATTTLALLAVLAAATSVYAIVGVA